MVNQEIVLDFETDEKDNHVGTGVKLVGQKCLCYFDKLPEGITFKNTHIIGHTLKRAEAKWMRKWGVPFDVDNLYFDVAIASYVMNATKPSHALKDLAEAELGIKYPTYDEMVGEKKNKVTLDKQPALRVARYCGMDLVAQEGLYLKYSKDMTAKQKWFFDEIEMPTTRLLFLSEERGVRVDREHLANMDREYKEKHVALKAALFEEAGHEFNPNSNGQKADILEKFGFKLPQTKSGNRQVSKEVLQQFQGHSFVDALLDYNAVNKLLSTYTGPLLVHSDNPESRIYTTYNQITKNDLGISSGRISSSDPVNLQNIPARADMGKQIRSSFIAKDGHVIVDLDLSQIEPRILAHLSGDPVLINFFQTGEDPYLKVAELAGESRDFGKKFFLAVMYGVTDESLAIQANVAVEKIIVSREKIYNKLHYVKEWMEKVKFESRISGSVSTMFGRTTELPDIKSNRSFFDEKSNRRRWPDRERGERQAVNYSIQGPAADIMKMANIACWKKFGMVPVLQVHDERLDEVPEGEAEEWGDIVKNEFQTIVELRVPLIAEVGIGRTWAEAKG